MFQKLFHVHKLAHELGVVIPPLVFDFRFLGNPFANRGVLRRDMNFPPQGELGVFAPGSPFAPIAILKDHLGGKV